MLKPSFFRKQNLSPKQKAILSYWQETKGVYVENPSKELVKGDQSKPIPPFNETEYRQLVDFSNEGDLLEYYMWTQILDAISLSDMSAQGHFSELVSFIQITTFGMPCGLDTKVISSEGGNIDHDHEYYAWNLDKVIKYDEGLTRFMFYTEQFFESTIQAQLLNLYMDDVASPLISQDLLLKTLLLDNKIKQYLQRLNHPVQTAFKRGGFALIGGRLSKCKEEKIDKAERDIRQLFQPLEVFYYSFQNEKLEICSKKLHAIINQAQEKVELDIA
jgi:hypothetical protein